MLLITRIEINKYMGDNISKYMIVRNNQIK